MPSPSADSKISQATHPPPPPPPITFNHEGALWQQSAFSKNVSGWSPKPIQHKKLPGGQREKQPGGVQHDQGEVYQKPITFRRVIQSGQVEIK